MTIDLLISQGFYWYFHAKEGQNILIELTVESLKEFIDILGEGEVEKDIQAAESEIVEETKEVDGKG